MKMDTLYMEGVIMALPLKKKGVILENRFFVPYNWRILLKYQTHINVEFYNQSRSIKYIFKDVNKGHDWVTIAFYENAGDTADN